MPEVPGLPAVSSWPRAAYPAAISQPSGADAAPAEPFLTGYDMAHLVTYCGCSTPTRTGADWKEATGIVLEIDVRIRNARNGSTAHVSQLTREARAASGRRAGKDP
jgi:hypothetical protein